MILINNMEKYKQQIIDRCYSVITETEEGITFVNEDVQFCVILLKTYKGDDDKEKGFELHKILKSKFSYAEKCTICVIIDTNEDKEKIQRNEYFYSKIFTDRINILPIKSDKSIKISFSSMKDVFDTGDYTVNAFDYFDGLCCINYMEYLSKAKNGDIVKYPKIANNSYFRYIANKLYSIEVIE